MLRAYRDLCLIEDQKRGLSHVIEASANVQNTRNLQTYATAVLSQLTSLLKLRASAFYCVVNPRPGGEQCSALTVATTAECVDLYVESPFKGLPEEVEIRCKEVLSNGRTCDYGDAYVFLNEMIVVLTAYCMSISIKSFPSWIENYWKSICTTLG